MKICIFGGTFDPPHIGHLIIAEMVKESEDFDKMIFIPAGIPPHKAETDVSTIEDRLAMLRLALEGNKNFELSNVEIKRGGISYAIDTIRELKQRYNLKSREIYFLIGSDSLKEFHTWHEPEKILEESQVLVAARPGFRPSWISPEILSHIHFANVPQIEISSSLLRQRIIAGLTVRYAVPYPVEAYILEKGLYRR
ncbi:MAG: nicotinate-nucleotide adenylyltransferase [Fidelibacterota bacterium]